MSDNTTETAPPASTIPLAITERGLEALKLFERERACYRRLLPRLVADGEKGRFALIKADELLSIWDTWGDANQAGLDRFGLEEQFCIQKIDPEDEQRFALLDSWKAAQCRA